MKKLILALFILTSTSVAFGAKSKDSYNFTYLDMLKLTLSTEADMSAYDSIVSVEFKSQKPNVLNIDVEVKAGTSDVNKQKAADYYKSTAKEMATNLSITDVVINSSVSEESDIDN